ncbi:lipopolysaccharide assembly protein LapA domain-containing protein [Luminiphilus sp.]|nr:lipopolysaccharide assembly protein LapA domain-containing protein [Luminiphilus sp.]
MRLLRQFLTVLFALCALLSGGLFALQNTQAVPLDLLLFQLPEQSIAIWLLLALGLGVLLGLSAGSLIAIRRAATIRSLRKRCDRLLLETQKGQADDR